MSHSKTLLTIGDWIESVSLRYEEAGLVFGHGTDNAWDEAVQTVLFALQLPLDSDRSIITHKVHADEALKIDAIVSERIHSKKPLPYLTHCAWFMGRPFYVDERVLIPRSPLGEWIERQFQPWIDPIQVKHILDIGTGSGCIAIGAALVFKDALVDAADIDPNALAVATINIEQYGLQKRVHLFQSDCFNELPSKRYDVILSNPPYVDDDEMKMLPKEYQHEPVGALRTDDEGLAIAERILQQASRYLSAQGILLLEVGYNAERLQSRYPNIPFVWLEQEQGGEGILMIQHDELKRHVW